MILVQSQKKQNTAATSFDIILAHFFVEFEKELG